MTTNFLKLNADKTEYLLLGSDNLLSKLSDYFRKEISICDFNVLPSLSARNIGVVFDQNMTMQQQVNNITKVCFYQIRNIGRIRKNLSDNATKSLVHALVTSRLDNCNALLIGIPSSLIDKLQKVQNSAARLITKSSFREHITPILYNLHWLPILYRIRFKILLLTFKCLNGMAPSYLSTLLELYTPSRTLRSASHCLLVTKSVRLVGYGERSFAYQAPHLWNSLPFDVRSAQSLSVFKNRLKTFLFVRAFD